MPTDCLKLLHANFCNVKRKKKKNLEGYAVSVPIYQTLKKVGEILPYSKTPNITSTTKGIEFLFSIIYSSITRSVIVMRMNCTFRPKKPTNVKQIQKTRRTVDNIIQNTSLTQPSRHTFSSFSS